MIQPKTPFLTPTTSKNPKEPRFFFFFGLLDECSTSTQQGQDGTKLTRKSQREKNISRHLSPWFLVLDSKGTSEKITRSKKIIIPTELAMEIPHAPVSGILKHSSKWQVPCLCFRLLCTL